jgi:glycosyltransferase involved in cell wall biosynthesis
MKILYIAHRIPYPPNKGDKIRSFNEIKYLSQRHEFHLACLADDPNDLKYENDLKNFCKTTNVILINPKLVKLKSTIRLFSTKPLSVSYFYSRKLQHTVDHLLSANDYDAVFCFSSPMAEYVFKSRVLSPQSIVHSFWFMVHRHWSIVHRLINHRPSHVDYTLSPMDHRPRTKLIMDFVDVDSDKWTQYSKYARFPMSWIYALEGRRLADYEKKVAEAFDHSVFVTEAERRVFLRKNPDIQNVCVIFNGVDLDYFSPNCLHQESGVGQDPSAKERGSSTIDHEPSTSDQQRATGNQNLATRNQSPETSNKQPSPINHRPTTIDLRPVIVFTGAMDYYANVDGVVWFTKEILPLIRKEIPEIQFYIVGSNPTKEVLSLSSNNGVTVTGYVPDTREYLRKATVAVVPLRIARGIQNKILEAMAMGIPVVATPQAFEGIEAKPDRDLILGEDEGKIAESVVKLIKEVSLRKCLSGSGRAVMEKNYWWTKNLEKLNSILTG